MTEVDEEILEFPDPRLRRRSEPVTVFDDALAQLLARMGRAMEREGGIGIAAPQLGAPVRAFLVDLSSVEGEEKIRREFVNPELRELSGHIAFREGCLSVPGFNYPVARARRLHVRYQDRSGVSHELEAEGLLAVAIQHEFDHLEGTLFVDRLPWPKRWWYRWKLSRAARR
jgi:peptide deformylase